MASSKPLTSFTIRKGQSAMVCELCESDPKLKWKCLDCRRMMCDRCRNTIHPKFPSAVYHTIIDIKDISKYQEEQKLDFTQLKCTEHARQNCCLFCKPCDQLVCAQCITQSHKKHDLVGIIEEYQIKVEKIKTDQGKITHGLETLSKGQNQLKKIKYLEESSYNKSKQDILEYEKELNKAVKTHINDLVNELDQKWKVVTKSLDEAAEKVTREKETLQQQNEKVIDILNSNEPQKVFSEVSIETNTKPVNTTFNPVPKFVPGDVRNITTVHGKLENVPNLYNTDLKVVQEFNTDLSDVCSLKVCPDSSLWIQDMDKKLLQKVTPTEENLKIKSNFKIGAVAIAITPSGDVLLSGNGSHLKVVPSGTEEIKDSPYNVSPLQPVGIHVTQDNKIIIGAADTLQDLLATGPRQVIILDQSGRKEKVFQYDKHNQALFTLPVRVTSTSNNNIGVVDMLSEDDQGRVVILNSEGHVVNIYYGHPDVNNEDNPFTPADIITTPSDNFIITDMDNHTLHILSSNGEMITYYNIKELGIELPRSLSFSQTGMLYIGCGTYEDSEKNSKIYNLDNFVW